MSVSSKDVNSQDKNVNACSKLKLYGQELSKCSIDCLSGGPDHNYICSHLFCSILIMLGKRPVGTYSKKYFDKCKNYFPEKQILFDFQRDPIAQRQNFEQILRENKSTPG